MATKQEHIRELKLVRGYIRDLQGYLREFHGHNENLLMRANTLNLVIGTLSGMIEDMQ